MRSSLSLVLVAALSAIAAPRAAEAQGLWQGTSEARAKKAFASASILLGAGKKSAAEKQYRLAITLNPRFDIAIQAYALYLYGEGRIDEGNQVLKDGIKRNPEKTQLKAFYGLQLCRIGQTAEARRLFQGAGQSFTIQAVMAQCAMGVEKYAQAVKGLRNYLQNRPAKLANLDNVMRLYLARALMRSGKLAEAEKELKIVLAATPDKPRPQLAQGELQLRQRRCVPAIRTFRTLYPKMGKERSEIRLLAGRAFLCLERPGSSLKLANIYLKGHDDKIAEMIAKRSERTLYSDEGKLIRQAVMLRGNAQLQLKAYDAALADYAQLIKLEGHETSEINFRRAQAFFGKRDYRTSLATLDEQLKKPDTASRNLVLALRASARLKQYGQGIKYAERLLARKPVPKQHYFYAGVIYKSSGDFGRAGQLLEQAVALDAGYKPARNELFKVYGFQAMRRVNEKKLAEAIEVLKKADQLKPDPKVKQNLALLSLRLKRNEPALAYASEVLKVQPKNHVAARIAGRALAALGRPKEALPHFRVALREAPQTGLFRAKVLVEAAHASINAGDFEVALNDLKKAKRIVDKDKKAVALARLVRRNTVRASYLYGQRLYDRGRQEQGWKHILRALRKVSSLPKQEEQVIRVGAAFAAPAVRISASTAKLVRYSGPVDAALNPDYAKIGTKLLAAYRDSFSARPATRARALRNLERLAASAPPKVRYNLRSVAAGIYLQMAYRNYRAGRAKQARAGMMRASKYFKKPSAAFRHNLAVANFYAGGKKEALTSLRALAPRVPLAYCNLGVAEEAKDAMEKSLGFYEKCLAARAAFPNLKSIVAIKRQIFR